MTEGSTKAAPPAAPAPVAASDHAPGSVSQRRKPRRKRNAGKKNEAGGKGGGSKSGSKKSASGGKSNNSNGPPPPPQIKITIRNIQNSEKFGSVKSILQGLIDKLMESCVEKKANNQYAIELDRAAVRYLITEEEKIEKRRKLMILEKAKLKKEKLNEMKDLKNDGKDDGDNPAENYDDEDEKGKIEEVKEELAKQDDDDNNDKIDTLNNEDDNSNNDKLDVILAPKPANNLPTIIARPSYVVPPRKTRRRGERGGTAYVLLIGPKIERKKPTTICNTSSNQSEQHDSTDIQIAANDESDSIAEPSSNQTPDTNIAPEKVINYPQELAKGRLLLSNTIKSLIELVAADSKSQEFAFSGCVVEHSMNGKTWKIFQNNNSRPDRREGTIEGTADFKDWLETTANKKEELKARPKPLPGGGINASTASTTTAGDDEVEEDGKAVSSLVQHLRTKKLDARRKKSQKKKKKEDSNKTGKSNSSKGEGATAQSENEKNKKRNEKKSRKNNGGGGAVNGTIAAAAKKAKRKKKERAKKKEKAKAGAAAATATTGSKAPTALLKPQST